MSMRDLSTENTHTAENKLRSQGEDAGQMITQASKLARVSVHGGCALGFPPVKNTFARPPIGDSPRGALITERSPSGDQRRFGTGGLEGI